MKNRKGQLSIETMIIYGLVILVTLMVIGGLIYFKVLDLSSYLPDKCDLGGSGDLKCEEWSFTTNGLSLGIRNTGQKPIESLTVSVSDETGVNFVGIKSGDAILTGGTLAPGQIVKVDITDAKSAGTGKILRGPLTVTYKYKEGAIEMKTTGSIRVKSS